MSLGEPVSCWVSGPDVVIMGDGQVTLGDMIIKDNVRKLRRINDNIIAGFAGEFIQLVVWLK